MKKLMLVAAVACFSFAAMAQAAPKAEQKEMKKEALKDHKCTAACKEGKHVYAHGEKGHKCTDTCKKA